MVDGGVVMCEQCEEHGTQHKALWDTRICDDGDGVVVANSHILWKVCEKINFSCAQRRTKAQCVEFVDQSEGDDSVKCRSEVHK